MSDLLTQAETYLQAGQRKQAALAARKVIEEHDFEDVRAWEILHLLAGQAGEALEPFHRRIVEQYYPQRTYRPLRRPTDTADSDPPPAEAHSQPAAPAIARWLGAIAILCAGLGFLAFGLPLGVAAILLGGLAYLLGARVGLPAVGLGVLDVVLSVMAISLLGTGSGASPSFAPGVDVQMRVRGQGVTGVSYTNSAGGITTKDVRLPWHTNYTGYSGEYVSLIAGTNLDYPDISCQVYLDGDLWLTSSDQYNCMVTGNLP